MTTQPMIAPNGFWIKTHVYQEGNWLKAKSYMVVAGDPIVFEVGVDLNRVAKAVMRYHQGLHQKLTEAREISGCIGCDSDVEISGLFGSLKKAVNKVGKSSIVKAVSKTANKIVGSKITKTLEKAGKIGKAVLKSKITAGLVAATAVVFPPVGVPATAAYATANAALAAVERANALKKAAQKVVGAAKSVGKAVKILPSTKKKMASTIKLANTAKTQIAKLQVAAKTSTNPQQRAEAQKMVKVLGVVAKSRENLKKIPVVTPAQQSAKVAAANAKTLAANQKTLAAKAATQRATTALRVAKQNPSPAANNAAKLAAAEALRDKAAATASKVEALKAQAEVIEPVSRSQGLIVTERGLIVRGAFNELPVGSGGIVAKMYHPGRSFTGEFQQIAGALQVRSALDDISGDRRKRSRPVNVQKLSRAIRNLTPAQKAALASMVRQNRISGCIGCG